MDSLTEPSYLLDVNIKAYKSCTVRVSCGRVDKRKEKVFKLNVGTYIEGMG